MDCKQIAALWLYYRLRKRQYQRQIWVHTINERKDSTGLASTIVIKSPCISLFQYLNTNKYNKLLHINYNIYEITQTEKPLGSN